MAALGPGDDGQAFARGRLRRGDDRTHADRVDGDGFFHENVLAGLDGGLQMKRPETGRGGGDDEIHLGDGADLEVVVETGEPAFVRNADPVRKFFQELLKEDSTRSGTRSPRATTSTPAAAFRQSIAAPVPRPPQPMTPTRRASDPAGEQAEIAGNGRGQRRRGGRLDESHGG